MSNDDFLIYYDKEEMNEFEKKTCYQDEKIEERKQIIENMISNGITISEVSKMINISEEEIHKLID